MERWPDALCFALGVTLGTVIMSQEVSVTTPEGEASITFSGFGGAPQSLSYDQGAGRLSDVIANVYSSIGFRVQDLVARPDATIEDVKDIVASTLRDSDLRDPPTQSSLDAIRRLESGDISDDSALPCGWPPPSDGRQSLSTILAHRDAAGRGRPLPRDHLTPAPLTLMLYSSVPFPGGVTS